MSTVTEALIEIVGDEGKAYHALEILVQLVRQQAESYGMEFYDEEQREIFDALYDGLHKEYHA